MGRGPGGGDRVAGRGPHGGGHAATRQPRGRPPGPRGVAGLGRRVVPVGRRARLCGSRTAVRPVLPPVPAPGSLARGRPRDGPGSGVDPGGQRERTPGHGRPVAPGPARPGRHRTRPPVRVAPRAGPSGLLVGAGLLRRHAAAVLRGRVPGGAHRTVVVGRGRRPGRRRRPTRWRAAAGAAGRRGVVTPSRCHEADGLGGPRCGAGGAPRRCRCLSRLGGPPVRRPVASPQRSGAGWTPGPVRGARERDVGRRRGGPPRSPPRERRARPVGGAPSWCGSAFHGATPPSPPPCWW